MEVQEAENEAKLGPSRNKTLDKPAVDNDTEHKGDRALLPQVATAEEPTLVRSGRLIYKRDHRKIFPSTVMVASNIA